MAGVMGDDALLQKAIQDLLEAWNATEAAWHDDARDEFAEHHLKPIEGRARDAVKAINMLESLLAEATRQCQ